MVIISTALQVQENAINGHMYDVKQCLHLGCVWHYSAASLALVHPWLSYCLWTSVCTAVLDLGITEISYDIVMRNAILYST